MEVGYCHLIDGQRSATNNSSRLEKRAPPIALINPLLLVREPEIARPRGRPQGAENRRAEAFDNSTHRLPSQFERVEMETADAIAPEVERAIHRANTTPGRVGRRGRGRGRGRGGGGGGGGGIGERAETNTRTGRARARASRGRAGRGRGDGIGGDAADGIGGDAANAAPIN